MKAKQKNRRGIFLALALAGLALALLAGGGCAEKITGTLPTARVAVDLGLKSTLASVYRLTVTAADMDTLVAYADTVAGQVLFAVEVPVGPARRFLAEALDNQGTVLYRGSLVRDLTPLVQVDVPIAMRPAAPMIYLIPHDAVRPIGSDFVVTICVNDLPGLSGAGVGLSLYGLESGGKIFNPVVIDTVLLDPDQVARGNVLSYQVYGPAEIYFDVSSEGNSIADAEGDACLVTVRFHTQDTWSTEPVFLYPSMYIEYLGGTEESAYVDGGHLTLYRDRVPEFYLDYGGAEIGMNLIPLGGGDIVLGGSIATGIEVVDYGLLMVTLAGGTSPRPPRNLPWSSQLVTTDMVQAVAGGYFATGTTGQGNLNEVVSLTPDGSEIWRRPAAPSAGLYAVAARPGGGCVVAGNWPSDGTHLLLVAMDDNGETAAYQPTDFSNDQSFQAVLALNDSTFVAAGQERPFQIADDTIILGQYVRRGGTIVSRWEKRFVVPGDVTVGDLLRTSDNGYLIVGASTVAAGGSHDVLVIRTDPSGNAVWTRSFGGKDDEVALAAVAAGDGTFVVAGYSAPLRNNRDVLLMKVGGGGDLVWQRLHGGPNDEVGLDLVRTSTGYLVTGTTNFGPSGGRDVLLLRVDGSGN